MTKEEFIKKVRDAIIAGETELALDLLVSQIYDVVRSFTDDVILQSSRFKEAEKRYKEGIIGFEKFSQVSALVRSNIIKILEDLEKPSRQHTSKKKGSLLYKIPSTMKNKKEYRCIVRVAYDTALFKEKLTIDKNTIIEDIQLTRMMSAELVDNNIEKAFEVRTCTDEEQFVVHDDYTQWLFDVKPIKLGRHTLTLKISALEDIYGELRKRNIVFEKGISIESETKKSKKEGFIIASFLKIKRSKLEHTANKVASAAPVNTSIPSLELPSIAFDESPTVKNREFNLRPNDQEHYRYLQHGQKKFSIMSILKEREYYKVYKKHRKKGSVQLDVDISFSALETLLKNRIKYDKKEKEVISYAVFIKIKNAFLYPLSRNVFYKGENPKISENNYPWTKISEWVGKKEANRLYDILIYNEIMFHNEHEWNSEDDSLPFFN